MRDPILLPLVLSMMLGLVGFAGCAEPEAPQSPEPDAEEFAEEPEETGAEWALAIHGGAGTISRDLPEDRRLAYEEALEGALRIGREVLHDGGTSLDAVERVVAVLEEDPLFNAGRGAVYTHEGTHELDAAIMDGRSRDAGAVAGVTTVRNPIRLARLVMERSPHVFLVGAGAEALADELELERVENSWFDTERRREQLERAIERENETGAWHERFGTVGAVALDRHGNLAAATSTGGMTNKRFGRVGDVPVIGAGTYADNRTCAVSGTGHGERFIVNTVARDIAARMEYQGSDLATAARQVIHEVLEPGDGGIIAVDGRGTIVWELNTTGMYRGAADSKGRFETAIWE